MYRQSAAPLVEEKKVPSELIYAAVSSDARRGMSMATFQLFALPALVGAALAMFTTPTIGLVGIIASALGLYMLWRRRSVAEKLVLRVEQGQLLVLSGNGLSGKRKTVKARFPLRELRNVVFDTKTIQRVEEGADAIPAMRFINARVSQEVDTARVVLVGRDASFTLDDEYLAHMDASEWIGKIRVFLRKHGWVPEDEREDEGPSSAIPSSAGPTSE